MIFSLAGHSGDKLGLPLYMESRHHIKVAQSGEGIKRHRSGLKVGEVQSGINRSMKYWWGLGNYYFS